MSAENLCTHSSSSQDVLELARLRIYSIVSLFFELAGIFLIVYGALHHDPKIFLLGVLIKICSYLTAGVWHNKAGIYLQLWWTRHLATLRQYQKEFSGILNELGLTDQEIQSISLLPQELYACEIAGYPYSRLLNILTPFVCSLVLLLQHEYIPALVIMGLGVLILPLGRYFFKEFHFRQQHELRLATSAKSSEGLSIGMQKHLLLSLRVNTISQLPLMLFSLLPFLGIGQAVFANYLAFTLGLSGLTGLLAFQKTRVTSQHSVKKATSLLHALSNPVFLLSSNQFAKHCQENSDTIPPVTFKNGIIIQELIPDFFINRQNLFKPISISIPNGGSYILKAPSGYGKSLVILALKHLINHRGEVFFVNDGKAVNTHSLCQKYISQAITFFRAEDMPPSARLIDIFATPLKKALQEIYDHSEKTFGSLLNELAWDSESVLIEQEVALFEKEGRSVFPEKMMRTLKDIWEKRKAILETWLQSIFENNTVFPDRVFCTLSAGEQKRVINLLTLLVAQLDKEVKLVVLDEPLANLDEKSIARQIELLTEFQQKKAIPLFIVTHHHMQELTLALKSRTKNQFADYANL